MSRQRATAGIVAATLIMAMGFAPSPPAKAVSTLTITTTADLTPPCRTTAFSLRCAIAQANADGTGDTITFHIPASAPGCAGTPAVCIITPITGLPTLTASSTIIDGYSQPGAHPNTNALSAGDNAVITIHLNGRMAGQGANGLTLAGARDTVEGLSITGFQVCAAPAPRCQGIPGTLTGGSGVEVRGSGDVVAGSFLGVMPDGTTAGANQFAGVNVVGSEPFLAGMHSDGAASAVGNDTIGGTTPAAGNVLSGNSDCVAGSCYGFGAYIFSGSGSVIERNYIGTSASGTVPLTNSATGVVIVSPNNTVGSTASGQGNVISGSGGDAVLVGAGGVLVAGNLIGTNAAGTAAINGNGLGNASHGVDVQGPNTTIRNNIISASGDTGLVLENTGAVVQGNKIGTDVAGTHALGNGFHPSAILFGQPVNGTDGVVVCAGPNTIGGTTSGAGNLISGNAGDGISLVSSGNTVQGNMVGTNLAGTAALPNGVDGIGSQSFTFKGVGFCQQAPNHGGSNNTIGGNLVSGNTGNGVNLFLENHTTVSGNRIGTTAAGTAALGNGGDGVIVAGSCAGGTCQGSSFDVIGGTSGGAGNTIAYNAQAGVLIGSSSADTKTHSAVQRNAIFANGGLGIDLAPRGTVNCTTSPPGPNDYTPCPVTTSATTAQVSGTACASCTVDVYIATNEADDHGHGEGQTFLGSATADASGAWSLTLSAGQVSTGQRVTATATTPASSGMAAETSEFAANVVVG